MSFTFSIVMPHSIHELIDRTKFHANYVQMHAQVMMINKMESLGLDLLDNTEEED